MDRLPGMPDTVERNLILLPEILEIKISTNTYTHSKTFKHQSNYYLQEKQKVARGIKGNHRTLGGLTGHSICIHNVKLNIAVKKSWKEQKPVWLG